MTTTNTTPMNAGQKVTITAGAFLDGAGNPVAALPAGVKLTWAVLAGNLTVTPSADSLSAVVQAGLPSSQGQAGQVSATLAYTDSFGFAHNSVQFWGFNVNFDPGVVTSFSLSAGTPA